MDHDDRKALTAKQRGGRRPGSGRPEGSKNTLAYGEVRAVKAIRHRVPEGTPEQTAALADRALDKIVAVMDGEVHPLAAAVVLKAATRVREEICGPVAQKLQVDGQVTIKLVSAYAQPESEEGASDA